MIEISSIRDEIKKAAFALPEIKNLSTEEALGIIKRIGAYLYNSRLNVISPLRYRLFPTAEELKAKEHLEGALSKKPTKQDIAFVLSTHPTKEELEQIYLPAWAQNTKDKAFAFQSNTQDLEKQLTSLLIERGIDPAIKNHNGRPARVTSAFMLRVLSAIQTMTQESSKPVFLKTDFNEPQDVSTYELDCDEEMYDLSRETVEEMSDDQKLEQIFSQIQKTSSCIPPLETAAGIRKWLARSDENLASAMQALHNIGQEEKIDFLLNQESASSRSAVLDSSGSTDDEKLVELFAQMNLRSSSIPAFSSAAQIRKWLANNLETALTIFEQNGRADEIGFLFAESQKAHSQEPPSRLPSKAPSSHLDDYVPLKGSTPFGTGLINIGNTCFFNSLYQAFLRDGELLKSTDAAMKNDYQAFQAAYAAAIKANRPCNEEEIKQLWNHLWEDLKQTSFQHDPVESYVCLHMLVPPENKITVTRTRNISQTEENRVFRGKHIQSGKSSIKRLDRKKY